MELKLIDIYKKCKLKYSDYLILIVSGNFIVTFDNDAKVMNYLFDYQIINGKVGFPKSVLLKVKNMLGYNHINYILFDEKIVFKRKMKPNHYLKCVNDASTKLNLKDKLNSLSVLIENKITENNNNYYKIMEFLNEL